MLPKKYSPVGRFGNNTNESGPVEVGCRPCAAGKYQETEMSIDCDVCPTGFAADHLASTCDICPLGYFAPAPGGRAKPCAQCSSGMYADAPRSGDCKMCPSGGYTSANASSACLACPGGKYMDQTGSAGLSQCKECAAGRISNGGSSTCTTCGAGDYAVEKVTCSTCLPGNYCQFYKK